MVERISLDVSYMIVQKVRSTRKLNFLHRGRRSQKGVSVNHEIISVILNSNFHVKYLFS